MAVQTAGTNISIPQAGQYASRAGFSGNSLVVVVAIAIAESGLNTHAINPTDPYGGSFGVLQINGSHFGDRFGPNGQNVVSETSMFDPAQAFLFGWELSHYGKDFSPWSTYTSGKYTKYVPEVRQALNSPTSVGTQFPPYTGEPWYDYNIYSDYPATSYHNTDVGDPADTPITAPLAGTLTYGGYFDWGGAWTIKVDSPSANSGYKDYFVIHLDALNPNLKVGDHVNQGTLLGWSGGETSLSDPRLKPLPPGVSHHITQANHSTGPHLDIGVTNEDTGSLVDESKGWQEGKAASDHLVLLARQGLIPYGTGDATGTGGVGGDVNNPPGGGLGGIGLPNPSEFANKAHNALVQWPGFFGIAAALDDLEQFPGFVNEVVAPTSITDAQGWGSIPGEVLQSVADTVVGNTTPLVLRGVMIFLGFFLLLALLWQLAKPNMEAAADLVKLGALG